MVDAAAALDMKLFRLVLAIDDASLTRGLTVPERGVSRAEIEAEIARRASYGKRVNRGDAVARSIGRLLNILVRRGLAKRPPRGGDVFRYTLTALGVDFLQAEEDIAVAAEKIAKKPSKKKPSKKPAAKKPSKKSPAKKHGPSDSRPCQVCGSPNAMFVESHEDSDSAVLIAPAWYCNDHFQKVLAAAGDLELKIHEEEHDEDEDMNCAYCQEEHDEDEDWPGFRG